jgi:ribosomal protein S18 acetylase RimI-like enzyme
MTDGIFEARRGSDYEAFGDLIREYVAWGRTRYQDEAWFVDQVFAHQSLDDELSALSTTYGPPNGRTWLALHSGEVLGCGAYRHLGAGVCEMKRLFVSPRSQRRGTGRDLCRALIRSARDDGCAWMRLDTAQRMVEAVALYRALGFRDCAPYRDYPPDLAPQMLFMELPLA